MSNTAFTEIVWLIQSTAFHVIKTVENTSGELYLLLYITFYKFPLFFLITWLSVLFVWLLPEPAGQGVLARVTRRVSKGAAKGEGEGRTKGGKAGMDQYQTLLLLIPTTTGLMSPDNERENMFW